MYQLNKKLQLSALLDVIKAQYALFSVVDTYEWSARESQGSLKGAGDSRGDRKR